MKKVLCILMSILLMATVFVGCGEKSAETGRVYYLNFKPEQDAAWQSLAKVYEEKTGQKVSVVTAAQGKYEETLTAAIDKSDAPTIFQISGTTALDAWRDYCEDLKDTDVYKQLTSDDFAVMEDGKVYGVAYVYEGFGLIANKNLLKKAGYELSDIKDFKSLKDIAEDISKRKDELGFTAFTSSTLDSSSSWRFSGHLANMPLFYEFRDDNVTAQPKTIKGTYLDNYKAVWDLYTKNATIPASKITTATNAAEEFSTGKAVFYQNGTWAYEDVKSVGDENLGFIPIYFGVDDEKQGLCCGTENYWAINSTVSEADKKASLEFLNWVVTSEEGTKALAENMGFVAPFKSAKDTKNVLATQMNDYVKAGKYNVSWAFNLTPNPENWRNELVSALSAYTTGKGGFDAVKTAFVDGWAKEYSAAHS